MEPDYSRQLLLKEIGPVGQAVLQRSRVLVVGAGGLGSPVLQYLAGAGIGCLGIVDPDVLVASNLHRQPLYSIRDVGQLKVELAQAAVHALNPRVAVQPHAVRLTADNALALVRDYDVIVDCSDNFRTKFLINDAVVLSQRSAVFASVYQYEGQIQVYKPSSTHACLRCLWPLAAPDGLVGNCAEVGVLGPVPGAVGAMQALLTLKIVLGIPGQLEGELVLMDFMNFSSVNLKARRRPECAAPMCAMIHRIDTHGAEVEIDVPSMEALLRQPFELIDIRTAEEVAARPAPARQVEMSLLLADPPPLLREVAYLLICASGRRSLATALTLRERGYLVRSLAGGLQSIEAIRIAPRD